jgi:peptidoglycan/xylan/chitin deacetylase (PgdA/CDA1 family)
LPTILALQSRNVVSIGSVPLRNQIIITTSWDDGHPKDLNLAELLQRYGIRGTFYIPKKNSEGRSKLSSDSIIELAKHFEIGSHTIDHIRLPGLSDRELVRQISDSKHWLEDLLGREIEGFSYPGGKFNTNIVRQAREQGYKYARTIENFRVELGSDNFRMPTTLQFYPHSRVTLFKNILVSKHSFRKLSLGVRLLSKSDLVDRFKALVDRDFKSNEVLHFWGHSWEMQDVMLWDQLEELLRYINKQRHRFVFLTNMECISALNLKDGNDNSSCDQSNKHSFGSIQPLEKKP